MATERALPPRYEIHADWANDLKMHSTAFDSPV